MKKEIMFMLCAILAATTICTAQVKREEKAFCKEKCAEMTKRATERMKNDLSLTDEQTAKVEALNKEYLPQIRNCRKPMHHGKRGNHPMKKECDKANGCDKAKDCPNNKECKKNDCPKTKDCPKAKECGEAQKCDKANNCPKAKECPKAKKCDKATDCPKAKQHKKGCRNTGELPMGKSREEVQKIRKEYKEKLNAILTPEQQGKYKALRKEKREHRKPKNSKLHFAE